MKGFEGKLVKRNVSPLSFTATCSTAVVFYLHAQYRLFRKGPTLSEIGNGISSIDSNRSLYQYKLSYIHTCKHQLQNSFSTSLIIPMFLVVYYPLFCLWHAMNHLPYISWLYKSDSNYLGAMKEQHVLFNQKGEYNNWALHFQKRFAWDYPSAFHNFRHF